MSQTKFNTQRLTTSAVMIALAAILAMVCALIPFLNLPFGGGFTIAGMVPIVLISSMYGIILIIDYLIAYSVLGFGGIFRNKIKNKTVALALGAALALTLRYIAHIISGFIFYGAWAEWFFSQDNFYSIGGWILDSFSGKGLALAYSVFYNGLYMIPEIIITVIAAVAISRIPVVKIQTKDSLT